MKDILKGILLNLIADALLAGAVVVCFWLFPDMSADLRFFVAAIAVALAVLVLLISLTIFRRTFERLAVRLGQIWAIFSDRLVSIKTKLKQFQACLSGELDRCRSELGSAQEKLREEREKSSQLSERLMTLGTNVFGLFDREVGPSTEVRAVSEQAIRLSRAALSHHVTKIVYYDPDYPASWIKGENAEQARRLFVKRGFVEKDAQQLRDWLFEVLQNGVDHVLPMT